MVAVLSPPSVGDLHAATGSSGGERREAVTARRTVGKSGHYEAGTPADRGGRGREGSAGAESLPAAADGAAATTAAPAAPEAATSETAPTSEATPKRTAEAAAHGDRERNGEDAAAPPAAVAVEVLAGQRVGVLGEVLGAARLG
jgi:hypothetical protein